MLYEITELKKLKSIIRAEQYGDAEIKQDLLELLEQIGLDTLKKIKELIYCDTREELEDFTEDIIRDIENNIAENY